jgi:nickel transport protein
MSPSRSIKMPLFSGAKAMNAIFAIFLAVLVMLGSPGTARAHILEMNYLLSAQSQFEIEAKYGSGEPYQQAPVQVYAPNDPSKPWLEGTTDDKGHFAFRPDPTIQGEWTLKVGDPETSDHGDILTIPVSEKGVEVNLVSELPHASQKGLSQLLVLGLAALSGLIGSRLWSWRDR